MFWRDFRVWLLCQPLRGGPRRAVLAAVAAIALYLSLARMIAATVLRMWKDEEEYDPGRAGPPMATREG